VLLVQLENPEKRVKLVSLDFLDRLVVMVFLGLGDCLEFQVHKETLVKMEQRVQLVFLGKRVTKARKEIWVLLVVQELGVPGEKLDHLGPLVKRDRMDCREKEAPKEKMDLLV
jgi:hypothetical protein